LRRHSRLGPAHLFVSACPAPDLYDLAGLHALPDAKLVAEIERLGLSPEAGPSPPPEVMRALLPVLRADLGACASYAYRPEPPLAAPISAFAGADDAAVRADALEGWRRQTGARFELHLCPGGHHYLAHGRRLVTGVVARALLGELPEGARC
jgi:medium-chain acyl-[acyl-carrier-protein] hydrolase